jgi:putative CocE/NonD family hydrolase
MKIRRFLALFALLLVTSCRAQPEPYEKIDAMVPMRDGVRLNTEIYIPKNAHERLPLLMLRSAYGSPHLIPSWVTGLEELAAEGYIFVFQDIRGRFKSEGQFVMLRPPRDKTDPSPIDESTDSYDTIDWLIKNVPNNNGRVGVLGVSYSGWLTMMAMLDPHPALKAVSPQASPADMFLGDDFHHNGAFRLSYAFEYVAIVEGSNDLRPFKFDGNDTFDWYLSAGTLANADERYFHRTLPTWNDFVNHPNYDEFWKKRAFDSYLTRVTVPTLNVAGWWDQEDFYGPLRIYEQLEKHDVTHRNYLVVGPWNHGGWARGEGNRLGKIDFHLPASQYFREHVQAPFFAYFLKDKGKLELAEAIIFQSGANEWRMYKEWPPIDQTTSRKLYFRKNGKLSFDPPPSDGGKPCDPYVSDPSKPVPYRVRPIQPISGSEWETWLLEDQRFVTGRADVLILQTDTLPDDVTVTGNVIAHLVASTSGTDGDWIVKLIDVLPEDSPHDPQMSGYQWMIANDVFRGRFRKSFERPAPLRPNQPEEYTIDLHSVNHTFRKGHRIMIHVQSTWFPLIDRNPQKFVENIFAAKDSDYQPATQCVYHSPGLGSYIEMPIAK